MKIVIKTLLRWSWLLVLCLLMGWFGGKALASLLPPTYQVTSIVQLNVQARTSQIIQPVAAYAALVTSDPLVNPVLMEHKDIDRQTFVTKQLVVTSDDPSQTITIQVTLSNAKEAVAVANQIAQLLVLQQNAYIQSQYNTELQVLKVRIDTEQKAIDQLNQKIAQTPSTDTAAIQQFNSQVSQQQNLQNQDLTDQQSLMTEQALYRTPLSTVQSATIPSKPSSLIGLIPLAPVIFAVVLVLGLAAVSFLERRTGRINGVTLLQQKTAVPVLGSLRWTKPTPKTIPIYTLSESKAPYAEECRIMMADVLFNAEEADAHILAITGLKENSGVSCIASQLATLLAQSKRRVLLIDANLHNPSLHKRLNLPNNPGLTDMLEEIRLMRVSVPAKSEKAPTEMHSQAPISLVNRVAVSGSSQAVVLSESYNLLRSPFPNAGNGKNASNASLHDRDVKFKRLHVTSADAQSLRGTSEDTVNVETTYPFDRFIVPTTIQNLYLLPAGKQTAISSSLLSMPEMGQFLRWTARPIDFVVIDCPALIHAEAHVLGSLSDQTYLVVDATKDRLKQVANARQGLLNTGIKLAGLIVNKLGRWV